MLILWVKIDVNKVLSVCNYRPSDSQSTWIYIWEKHFNWIWMAEMIRVLKFRKFVTKNI